MVGGHFWSYPLPQRLKPGFHRRFIAGLKPCAAQKQEQIPPVGRNDKRLCCRSPFGRAPQDGAKVRREPGHQALVRI